MTCSRHMTSSLKNKYKFFHSYVVAKWWQNEWWTGRLEINCHRPVVLGLSLLQLKMNENSKKCCLHNAQLDLKVIKNLRQRNWNIAQRTLVVWNLIVDNYIWQTSYQSLQIAKVDVKNMVLVHLKMLNMCLNSKVYDLCSILF
jgi:hypothetical protein